MLGFYLLMAQPIGQLLGALDDFLPFQSKFIETHRSILPDRNA